MKSPVPFDCATEPLDQGVRLLEASAGTGKTYALARIYLRLVAQHGVEVSKILVVTFTTAATEELRGRIRELLVDSLVSLTGDVASIEDATIRELAESEEGRELCIRRLRLAITCFDEAVIHTIHGFCNRVLAENSLETLALFEAELDQSADDLIAEAMLEYWRLSMAGSDPVVAASARVAKISTEDLTKFYKGLPATRPFRMGFDQGNDPETVCQELVGQFHQLRDAWQDDQLEYAQFVEECVTKRNRAFKQLLRHRELLDELFIEQSISPQGIEILRDVRASKLEVRKEFADRPKPRFACLADNFSVVLDILATAVRVDAANFLRGRIDHWKTARGLLSFDDLLRLTADAVCRDTPSGNALRESLRISFEAALIDEFQDTDPVQFKIFRELFGMGEKHRLYLIGDPKQSIYRFRGADLEAYFDFARATGAKTYSLNKNFRTTTPLVRSVNYFLSASTESPFLHPQLPFHPVHPNEGGEADQKKLFQYATGDAPALIIRELSGPEERPPNKSDAQSAIRTDMANEIFHLLQNGRVGNDLVTPGDIAVLVRSNWEARKVWEYFGSRGLPAIVFTDMSLFETDEAKELCWVLQGLADARSDRAVKRALSTGLLGMCGKDFQQWEENPNEWENWVVQFREIRKTWRKRGVYVALQQLFRRTGSMERNLVRPDGERRVTNFLHLAEVLHQATAHHSMSPSSLVVWLRTKMDQKDRSNEEFQLRLESESEAIRILTVHKSKGLEYPITFLPFLGFSPERKKGSFTYHDDQGDLVVNMRELSSATELEQGSLEENQEDARVLYVGLTRASSRCYLYHIPGVPEKDEPLTAQGRIFQGINQAFEGGGISGWIESLGNKKDISHEFIPLHPTDTANSSWRPKNPVMDTESLLHEPFPETRTFPKRGRIESFSSLTSQIDFEGSDLDSVSTPEQEVVSPLAQREKIFDFPAGAKAGNFMHDVFEHICFDDPSAWESLISEKLNFHQFDSSQWTGPILEMVGRVMNVELFPGFSLSSLSASDRMEEMEFLFPSLSREVGNLKNRLPDGSKLKQYLSGLDGHGWEDLESDGFITGFIDLVFRTNGRYFIVDWKSNLLNGRADGFEQAAVEEEMFDHHYILQYHLYVLAVHRFLRSRIPSYSYERDFGGVYYLFTRGVLPSTNRGIFYDRPSWGIVEKLEEVLCPALSV